MKTRNYGIDFLRMISMIMIVMLHTLGHGGILRSVSFLSVHYQIAWLLEVIAFGAVNTYAMISGFVSVDSHFKISNILILWLQVLFYGILINTVFFFLLPESRIHPAGYRHSFRSLEKNTGILLLMQECFFSPHSSIRCFGISPKSR